MKLQKIEPTEFSTGDLPGTSKHLNCISSYTAIIYLFKQVTITWKYHICVGKIEL